MPLPRRQPRKESGGSRNKITCVRGIGPLTLIDQPLCPCAVRVKSTDNGDTVLSAVGSGPGASGQLNGRSSKGKATQLPDGLDAYRSLQGAVRSLHSVMAMFRCK